MRTESQILETTRRTEGPTAPARSWWSSWTFFGLRLGVSVVLLLILIRIVEWSEVWRAFQTVPGSVVLAGVLLMLVGQALCALRLQLLLKAQGIPISFGYSYTLTLAALFAGNFLPSTVGGDALKVLALRWRGHSIPVLLATVLVDRLTNVTATIALISAIWYAPGLLKQPVANGLGLVATATAALVLITLAIAWWHGARRRDALTVPHVASTALPAARGAQSRQGRAAASSSWLRRGVHWAKEVASRWWARPGYLTGALLLSIVLILVVHFSLWLVVRAMGLEIGLLTIVAVCSLVAILSLLPVSLNALGVQEASLTYLLVRAGAPTEEALVVAILARFFLVAGSLPGAACLSLVRKEAPNDRHD